MKMKVYLFLCISIINICKVIPACNDQIAQNSSDCIQFHSETHFCCFVESLSNLAVYKTCKDFRKNETMQELVIGQNKYSIDCGNSSEFRLMYPYYGYQTCGVSMPISPEECWKANIVNDTVPIVNCCYGTSSISSMTYCINYQASDEILNKTYNIREGNKILSLECVESLIQGSLLLAIIFIYI